MRVPWLGWALAAVFVAGCGDSKDTVDGCEVFGLCTLRQSSPRDVVESLEAAYRTRVPLDYAPLLADDFQFFLDEQTRPIGVPLYWSRLEDSTGTARLFQARDVSDIRITLTYRADTPVVQAGRENWRRIQVTDTFLEVDKPPVGGGETLTLRVDGDLQDFYFRKGRTPADTLAGSATAKRWFLVEWRDLGRARVDRPSHAPGAATENLSWSSLKTLYR